MLFKRRFEFMLLAALLSVGCSDSSSSQDGGAVDGGLVDLPATVDGGGGESQWPLLHSANEYGSQATAVAIDASGNIYITGYFIYQLALGAETVTEQGRSDVFVAKLDPLGNTIWLRGGGSIDGDDVGLAIAVDGSGNVFVGGIIEGGAAIFGRPRFPAKGPKDSFIAKYSADGHLHWVERFGGPQGEVSFEGLGVDASGNVYGSGHFGGTVSFGSEERTSTVSFADLFLVKCSGSGQVEWVRTAGSENSVDVPWDLAVDAAGASYLVGRIGGATNFEGVIVTPANAKDGFVAKYDASGALSWVKLLGASESSEIFAVALAASGEIAITGVFKGDLPGGAQTLTSAGLTDIFVGRLDANGDLLWATAVGSTTYDFVAGIALDDAGNSYITGVLYNYETASFGATTVTALGVVDFYVAQFSPQGTPGWVRVAGGPDVETSANDIAVDGTGGVYAVGDVEGTAIFGEQSVTSSANSPDMIVWRLEQSQ